MVEPLRTLLDERTVTLDPTAPRILVFTPDITDAERVREACTRLECQVTMALDIHVAMEAATEDVHDLVFVDAVVGERRVSDIIQAAKRLNPGIAVLLLATPEQAEAEPMLLMMVGYEYIHTPVHVDAVAAEVRLRLDQQRMRRVSAALASTLEYRGLLEVLLRQAVQEVGADTGSLLIPQQPGGPLALEAALGLPDAVIAQGHEAREDGIAEWVYENGEPLILQGGFTDLPVSSIATDRAIASAMVLPLIVGHRTVGVLNVARLGASAEPFTLRQLRAMEIIGLQGAVAIHNAQTHRALLEQKKWEHELEVARAVQQHLLPRDFPRVPGVEVQAINLPAHQIGGDFYNVFRLGDARLGVMVADVSGKGIPGALLMTQSMNDMRRAVEEGAGPASVLALVNETVASHSTRGMFVTMFYAVLDFERGEVEFANAGHPPLLRVREGAVPAEFLGRAIDPPLGLVRGMTFTSARFPLRAGEALLLFTDGVIEAKNPRGEEFGFARLAALFHKRRSLPPSLVGFVAKSVQAFADTQPQHDDLTLLAIRWAAGAPD